MAENGLLSRLRTSRLTGIKRDTWMVFISLVLIFAMALFLRSYFGFAEATKYGAPFLVSGGSDSYYHERAIETAAYQHHSLLRDPMLNYPIGSNNPRPPTYAWSIVLMGYLISPLTGDLASALSYALIFSTAIWGALTVFPVYFIGKKAFNRKIGIIAAFLIATLPAHMQRSPLTNADHDAFVLFFSVTSIYFLLQALENLKEREWVDRWRDFSGLKNGLKEMLRENRTAFLYATLSGVSILTIALTWKGFSYIYLILMFYFVIQVFINRFRNIDATSITTIAAITLLFPLLLSLPYYVFSKQIAWLIAPTAMAVVAVGLGLIFSLTKKLPWTLVIPSLILGLIILAIGATIFFPSLIETVGRQTGYFTRSKVYKTIAEAQAPYFSNLVLSFGVATFFLALIGVGWIMWKMRKNWNPYFVFFVIWSAESIYMALSAARFMFNASPAFALASAWVIFYIIQKGDFGSIKKTYRSLSGNKVYAIKKSVKIRHVLVALFLVFMIILPNVWYAVDAGIPSNEKKKYDTEIYNAMPEFMRPDPNIFNESSGRTWYLGAFGYSLPTPNQYWPSAWRWFSTQDADRLPEDRPGFLSWWDYGFECIQKGKHPTVADNFQAGYQIAGNFIMAQNETDAISLLIERILDSEYSARTGEFTERSVELMKRHISETDVEKIIDIYRNPQSYVDEILSHPEKYGPYDSVMNDLNARYIASRGVLMKYEREELVSFLHDLEQMTGKRISYFAIDSRLIPFSAQNTGIFYAPAVLSDHRISSGGYRLPYDFYEIYAVTEYGKKYPINEVPDDVRDKIDHTVIEYKDMFYNTMLYRNYFGYSPKEAGSTENGLPGISENLKNMQPMPGWGLAHFRLVYRTAYWNPYEDYKNHSDAWEAVSLEEAMRYQKEGIGVVDMSPNTMYNGVTFLEYYEGAIINGTVKTSEGTPVGGIRVTVYDEYGIPHETVFTDKDGRYSVIAPFGNITLIASNGGSLDKIRLMEKNMLNSTKLNIRKDQARREKVDLDGDGKWDYLLEKDLVASTSSVKGTVFLDLNYDKVRQDVEAGLRASVLLYGKSVEINYTTESNGTGAYVFRNVVPGDYGIKITIGSYEKDANMTVTVEPNKEKEQDVPIPTGKIKGRAVKTDGSPFSEAVMRLVSVQDFRNKSFVTDDNGEFFVDGVIPGVYSFEPENSSYVASSFRIGVSENQTSDTNITVYPAHRLEGYININGKGVPFATINFINYTFPEMGKTVVCDKDGHYSVLLAEGEYTVTATYIDNETRYMVVKRLVNDLDSTISFDMSRAYRVTGYIKYKTYYKDKFPVTFIAADGARLDYYSVEGNYSGYLPAGTYHVYVDHSFALFPYAYSQHMDVSGAMRLDIDLIKGVTVKGYIKGIANSSIKGAVIVFTGENGETFRTISDERGFYDLNLVPGNYSMTVYSRWYETNTREITASEENNPMDLEIHLSPEEVEIYGKVLANSLPVSGINISFVGYNMTFNALSDANGNYSAVIPAGRYTISVQENITANGDEKYETRHVESVVISPDDSPYRKDVEIERRVRVSGNLTATGNITTLTIWISKGSTSIPYETLNGSFEIFLPPGNYTVNSSYIDNGTLYALFEPLSVSGPENVSMEFVQAYRANITIKYDDTEKPDIPAEIISDDGALLSVKSGDDGRISLHLPAGEYRVLINHTTVEEVEGITRNVTYSADERIRVNSDIERDVVLSRYVPEGNISGVISIATEPAGNIEVEIISTETSDRYTVITDSGGEFSAGVPMGTYIIYARNYAGDNPYSIMKEVVIGQYTSVSLEMSESVLFSGRTVKESGDGIKTNITLIRLENPDVQKTFETDREGNFEIVVPRGLYSVVASGTATEYGVETNFIYQQDLVLNFSTDMKIVMEKTKIYRPELSWNPNEKVSVYPGDSVIYHITVRNSGNVEDMYSFSGSPWTFEFEPSSVSLIPGEEREITVTITLPKDAEVTHEPVKITVSSGNSPGTVDDLTVEIDVREVYGVSVGSIVDSSWSNGTATYGIEITNTGNAKNTFSIVAINKESLVANGWNVKMATNKDGEYSEYLDGVDIDANTTRVIYVRIVPIAEVPAYAPELTLMVHSTLASTEKTLTLPLPSVEIKSDITLEGNARIWEEKPVDLGPVYWVLGFIVAVAAGYWVLKKKGVIM